MVQPLGPVSGPLSLVDPWLNLGGTLVETGGSVVEPWWKLVDPWWNLGGFPGGMLVMDTWHAPDSGKGSGRISPELAPGFIGAARELYGPMGIWWSAGKQLGLSKLLCAGALPGYPDHSAPFVRRAPAFHECLESLGTEPW